MNELEGRQEQGVSLFSPTPRRPEEKQKEQPDARQLISKILETIYEWKKGQKSRQKRLKKLKQLTNPTEEQQKEKSRLERKIPRLAQCITNLTETVRGLEPEVETHNLNSEESHHSHSAPAA